MSDQENMKKIQERIKYMRDIDPEWEEIYRQMDEGATKEPEQEKPKLRPSMQIWEERYPNLMMLEPREFFDEAIVGVVERINLTAFCYDTQKVLEIVEKRVYGEGCSPEEALEHFEFNIRGSYVGEHSPVFLDRKVGL